MIIHTSEQNPEEAGGWRFCYPSHPPLIPREI